MIRTSSALAALLCLASASSALAQSPQFDLVCTGTQIDAPRGKGHSYEVHYRIDTAAGRWCAGDCSSPSKIQEITPDKLTLHDSTTQAGRPLSRRWSIIYRNDGRHFDVDADVGYYRERNGRCTPAPYSGIPSPMF